MNQKIISAPITLSKGAVTEIKQLMDSPDFEEGLSLRIGVKSGGCSGFSYVIGFDDVKENDEQFTISGIPVIISKSHMLYLQGINLDYQQGLNNRGFVFENPNATDTCGCGSSFSAE